MDEWMRKESGTATIDIVPLSRHTAEGNLGWKLSC
jgi:hypothetical protein